jgi:hypothetical protein
MQYNCVFRQVLESCDSVRGIDATVTRLLQGLKMSNINCTWKTHLQSYLMITFCNSKLLWDC